MAEEKIELTLPKEEEMTLTLHPEEKKEEPKKPVEIVKMEDSLSEAERKQVEDFSKQIDITETNVILQYGADAQKKIVEFSDSALNKVKTKDLGQVGDMIGNLVTELKGFNVNEEEEKGFFGFFKKSSNKIASLKARYDSVETNVDKISAVLEDHQIQLMKDIALLDELYDHNLRNFKQLTMYVLAGKKRLEEARNVELPKLVEKAKQTGLPEDSQAANDYASFCDRFDKKLHDLELTRMISVQMGPQIRLVQNNDTLMSEKIQSTLMNTIPLWKSQMVLALGVEHSKQAMEAQREVTEMTNELLKKNAETLKMASIETAKEAEKGVVELETLQYTNKQLIETLDEVMKIHNEGRQKRRDAETELAKIESELKAKLLEVR
ncbi:MAG: toxic anion resistance protein [Bacilli bacterium]|nr:toxic anion resistance protein [Bacilli bacterium]